MKLDQLLERFANNNGVASPEPVDGRYQIAMEGAEVACFEEQGKLCLLCDLAPLAGSLSQRQADCRRLLEKNMELMRDSRAVLTVDQESGSYQLYQRAPLEGLSATEFQALLEKFGGCGRYFRELLGHDQGQSQNQSNVIGGGMMP